MGWSALYEKTLKPHHIMNTENQPIDLVSAALVECQGKLKSARMTATNPFFKSKYATLGDIIECSREPLHGAGLAIQQNVDLKDGLVSVHTVIRHKSGQNLDGGTLSLAIGENERNSEAQLAGSIMTYLKRYAWASVLGIYADEDDDGNSAPQRAPGAIPRRQTTPATTVAPQPSQALDPTKGASGSLTVGPKYRLQTLNKLQAAVGQHQRPLVHQYLTVKGYISASEEPEDWPFDKLPKSPEEFVALGEDIKRFEIQQREGPIT